MDPKALKVLMVSSDRQILLPGSAVGERMKEYGALVEELHIVILSDKSHGLKNVELDKNVWVYPTNSSANFFRPIDAARLGKKIILEKKFIRGKSLITADSLESGWAGVKIKKRWRIPLELQIHSDIFSKHFKGFKNKVRQFFSNSIIRNSDSIRVVSSYLAEEISQTFGFDKNKINVLPIYVDRGRIENARLSFDIHTRYPWHFIILTVSRLAPEKNLGLALKILSLVRQTFPDVGMVVVGSGSEESYLKSLAKKLGLIGAVEFAGWQEDLASYYKTANLFLQTSLFEGYGLSLIEAGLSGMPIVTTPVGIAHELQNGKDAYIFDATHPELFAQGIIDILENNFKRENLRLNIKRTLESKLISKEEYLLRLGKNWGDTALFIG